MNKKEAKLAWEKLGDREGVAERILQIAKEIVDSGSYKRAVAGAGQMQVLAEVCSKSDGYWREVKNRGLGKEEFYLENPKAIAPILGDDGHLSPSHWEREKK